MTINNPDLTQAVSILRAGGLVAFPTETVYGLGADASNEAAVRRVFLAKQRPFDHPLIVHIAEIDDVHAWAMAVSLDALRLAEAFWPGPLTLVLKKQSTILDVVTGKQSTVALRMPDHPIALALLRAFGSGLVAPSANQFTRISPTTAAAVKEELGDAVDLVLDGGACVVGVESTILDMSGDIPVILRPGMVTAATIAAVLGRPVETARQDTPAPRVPGQHHLHYAPTTKTVLVSVDALPDYLQSLSSDDFPVALMSRKKNNGIDAKKSLEYVVMPDEPNAYAHELYRTLRTLDHAGFKRIIVESVPDHADWGAIRDRLMKASGEKV